MTSLRSLGFDAVVLTFDAQDLRPQLEAAAHAGLKAHVQVAAIDGYVGGRPDDVAVAPPPAEFDLPTAVVRHPAFGSLWVPLDQDGSDSAAERVCAGARAVDISCIVALSPTAMVVPADAPGAGGPASRVSVRVAVITLNDAGATAPPQQRVLEQWHRALIAGQTGGFVVLGTMPFVARESSASQVLAVRATLADLNARTRQWQHLIAGATVTPGPNAELPQGIETAVMTRGSRRGLLVFNHSEEFVRASAAIPVTIAGRVVRRVVEVPASAQSAAGQVIVAGDGRVTIPVALRPGDAVLFELF